MTTPDPVQTAQRLARAKALAVREARPEAFIIAADTVVAIDLEGESAQLGKPRDEADALRILRVLQGETHTVTTGVALAWPGGFSAFTESSRVTFRPVEDAELEAYIATGEPMDKAGAYGLQGGAKGFLEKIEGSVSCVIGLPMERLKEALESIKY